MSFQVSRENMWQLFQGPLTRLNLNFMDPFFNLGSVAVKKLLTAQFERDYGKSDALIIRNRDCGVGTLLLDFTVQFLR